MKKRSFLHDMFFTIMFIAASPIILWTVWGEKAAGNFGGLGTILALTLGVSVDFARLCYRRRQRTSSALTQLRAADPAPVPRAAPPGDDWI